MDGLLLDELFVPEYLSVDLGRFLLVGPYFPKGAIAVDIGGGLFIHFHFQRSVFVLIMQMHCQIAEGVGGAQDGREVHGRVMGADFGY